MSIELSEVDTEYILEHFQDLTDGPFAELSSALRDLNKLPEVLAPTQPPLMPSQVLKNVQPFKRSAGRNATTIVVATAIAVSTTLGAAALTGVGPKPLVEFAKSTFKAIGSVGSTVIDIVSSPVTPAENSTPQNDSALPIPQPTAEALNNIEGEGSESAPVVEQKTQPATRETTKAEEQKAEPLPTVERHPAVAQPTPEVEHSAQASEKPEVKTVEVSESKAPEKLEVKSTPTPIVKVPEKTETKAPATIKPTISSTESKSGSEKSDD